MPRFSSKFQILFTDKTQSKSQVQHNMPPKITESHFETNFLSNTFSLFSFMTSFKNLHSRVRFRGGLGKKQLIDYDEMINEILKLVFIGSKVVQ